MTSHNVWINYFAIEIVEWHHFYPHIPHTNKMIQFQHCTSTIKIIIQKKKRLKDLYRLYLRRSIVPMNFKDDCPDVNNLSSKAIIVSKSKINIYKKKRKRRFRFLPFL
jgi:hypothetical protein